MTLHRGCRFRLGVSLLVRLVSGAGATAQADSLEREFLRQAPSILTGLQARGVKNVGVLKFRVKKGAEPVTDRVGTLNRDLATRLEVALILANDCRNPTGVIHDASAVAATIQGANRLVEAGRRLLFVPRYSLAWGDETVEPDAFLAGVAVLSPDLKTVTVGVVVFGRDGGKPAPLEIKAGKALVREPQAGRAVTLVLHHRDAATERYGVVLSVNGENALFRQRVAASSAQKWVLGPQAPTITIRGCQTGEKQAEVFRVLSRSESAKNAIDYGSDVGMITLAAFRESNAGVTLPSPTPDDEGEDLAAVTRGSFPKEPPRNLAALKSQLRSSGASETRGLVVGVGRTMRRCAGSSSAPMRLRSWRSRSPTTSPEGRGSISNDFARRVVVSDEIRPVSSLGLFPLIGKGAIDVFDDGETYCNRYGLAARPGKVFARSVWR